MTLCIKLVDLRRCNILAFFFLNVASMIVSARVLFLSVVRRTRIVVSSFLGVYLGAGGFLTIQSLSNAPITTRALGCTPVCVSDGLKLLHISQLEQRVVSLVLQSEWNTV